MPVDHLPHGSGDKTVTKIDSWKEDWHDPDERMVLSVKTRDGWFYQFHRWEHTEPFTLVHKRAPDSCVYYPNDTITGVAPNVVPQTVVEALTLAGYDIVARSTRQADATELYG